MKLATVSPSKALNRAYFKQSLKREQIELFKTELQNVFNHTDEKQDEEYHKNLISQFFLSVYCKGKYLVNVNKLQDLVIRLGNNTNDNVGVILEFKKPTERKDMISADKPNVKALQELVLYYLREAIDNDNHQIKHLIATNINEWYIFDEVWFEKNIFRNNKLKKEYQEWKVSGHDTKHFYELIAAKYLDSIEEEVSCTYFNLKDFEKIISNPKKADDSKLIDLYKILSPEHLLKKSFANDSNTLNKEFYNELLYLIGLEETKEGSKKLIGRKQTKDRNDGSLLENAITILKRKKLFGYTDTEETEHQYFEIALELCIIWLNRILFLKLLEGQLIKYHRGNKDFTFLNISKISDYDILDELFFEVLALEIKNRSEFATDKFKNVPYLNSSLFEQSEMEMKYIGINQLKDRLEMPIYNNTVLKDSNGKRISGNKNPLVYLYDFLDAYDFASDSAAQIQEQNKNIINASVLGLIFEKINGYKDGSFFTPGFITMYMCHEAIRKAVLQKFNDTHKWNCKDFSELKDKIDHTDKRQWQQANEVINSLKICDPAVGSGHFLVSALNELIAVKHDLQILNHRDGSRVKGFRFEIANDELVITNEETDQLFEYTLNQNNKPIDELQQLQEALFHEKQHIIENCLFGVDINPKSVTICRLRLWIELLKNSYYTKESKYEHIETLPNIDINIKCGNSLISRFALKDDVFETIPNFTKKVDDYKFWVNQYKETNDKKLRDQLHSQIEQFKNEFKKRDPRIADLEKKITKASEEIIIKYKSEQLFGNELTDKEQKRKRELEGNLKILIEEKENILNSKVYENAFEWRFEFPEVLNSKGQFNGFDVVIGNPPYIPLESFSKIERSFFREKYLQLERKYETSVSFIIEGLRLLNDNGLLSYIAPVTWQTGENYTKFRQHILSNNGILKLINLPFNVFEDAYEDTALYFLSKNPTDEYSVYAFNKKVKTNNFFDIDFSTFKTSELKKPDYKLIIDKSVQQFSRFDNDNFIGLGLITKSTQGLSGSNFPEGVAEEEKNTFQFLSKGNVYNYLLIKEQTYLTDLTAKKNLIEFYQDEPKILIRRIINRQNRLSVTYYAEKLVFKKDINPFIPIDKNFDPKYLTGVLASKFISYLYLNSSSIATEDDFRQTTLTELRKLPIPKADEKEQKKIIKLVDKIFEKKSKSIEAKTTDLENKIDELVYRLYELTDEEIKIIEQEVNYN